MYEKKVIDNREQAVDIKRCYSEPQLTKLGDCKILTKGGQIPQNVDNSGWANRNTAS